MKNRLTARRKEAGDPSYRIPKLWNCWGYDGPVEVVGRECAVDPQRYFSALLDWIKSQSDLPRKVRGKSLSQVRRGEKQVSRRGGDWIRTSIAYGMLIRSATAWGHDGDGTLGAKPFHDMGSFCKTILLLPHIKRLGVDALYLLPVSKVSSAYRKGELGCPYATQAFLQLDPSQDDVTLGPLVGDINDQFHLLVECAHRLGIRVLIDFAPRTVARDHVWILDHPEWFYWIDRRCDKRFAAPYIDGVEYQNPSPNQLGDIYNSPAANRHLKRFRFDPRKTHPQQWRKFVAREKAQPKSDLIGRIAQTFGVTTTPGYTDVINDPQPPWTDVTYLRLYADHPTESKKYLPNPADQPPYLHFDVAKSSIFQGKKPHRTLWNKLANIIPFYQKFGIDGARIDMAHALPRELEARILQKPRERDPDFCFVAEDLGTENHAKAKATGYNLMIGPSWWMQPRAQQGKLHEMIEKIAPLKLPVFASAESPDTPRAVTRTGGRKYATQMAVLNCLLPNSVPMINSGAEVYERQPHNLGLDANAKDQFALPKSDPYHGKLAFFDRAILHWTNRGAGAMCDTIETATALRRRFLKTLTNPKASLEPIVNGNARHIICIAYRLNAAGTILMVIANLDYARARRTEISGVGSVRPTVEKLMHIAPTAPKITVRGTRITAKLDAGECVVLQINGTPSKKSR
ncbi:MAG: maltodextrin glycosyltransferase [Phycisphaerae bacterium]|nr:MAG: maltodextrin glycosyltransferase [Phycisphaerae bacterium]